MPKLSVILPCFGRPARTRRMIDCILQQDTTHAWEAFIIGDGCPHFQELINSGEMDMYSIKADEKGNKIRFFNMDKNYGGHGYHIMNYAVRNAKGEYIIWLANDDMILPDHFSNYLKINDTNFDCMYFNSYLAPTKSVRNSVLAPSQIGHSEIIVKTELAKRAPDHEPVYGHDWDFIKFIINIGTVTKDVSGTITYHVMSIPNFGTVDKID